MADCSRAGMRPPVDLFVQGRMVRMQTSTDRDPLHVMMIVLVDIHEAPVYLKEKNINYPSPRVPKGEEY